MQNVDWNWPHVHFISTSMQDSKHKRTDRSVLCYLRKAQPGKPWLRLTEDKTKVSETKWLNVKDKRVTHLICSQLTVQYSYQHYNVRNEKSLFCVTAELAQCRLQQLERLGGWLRWGLVKFWQILRGKHVDHAQWIWCVRIMSWYTVALTCGLLSPLHFSRWWTAWEGTIYLT